MTVTIHTGDCRAILPTLEAGSVQTCVTSPPYFNLRSYLDDSHEHKHAEIGAEATVDAYVAELVAVFREVRRALADDGTLWLNLGSSYASGGSGSSRSRRAPHARAYGSDGTTLQCSTVPDSAYLGLCDECLADYRSHRGRIVGSNRHHEQSQRRELQTNRDSGHRDSAGAFQDASPLAAQESTTLESWRQLRGECSRCDIRAAALMSLGSSSRDGQGSAHMAGSTNGTTPPDGSSGSRTLGKGLSSTASVEPPIVQPQYTIYQPKPKDLIPIPWLVALALQRDGWYLRSDCIWAKKNCMPESVTDRPTQSHEYLFLLTKSARYMYDAAAIAEPFSGVPYQGRDNGAIQNGDRKDRGKTIGMTTENRNKRSVWTVATQPYSAAHFATFPPKLIEPCILAGSRPGDTVLDPFGGSGTTGQVAEKFGRDAILIELNPAYRDLIETRTAQRGLSLDVA